MREQCPFCVEARTEAAKQVYKWLVSTMEPIPRNRANYLRAGRTESGPRGRRVDYSAGAGRLERQRHARVLPPNQ